MLNPNYRLFSAACVAFTSMCGSMPVLSAAELPSRWGDGYLRQSAEWYASAPARATADTVLLYQSSHGAWPKNTDLLKLISPDALAKIQTSGEANTIDNGATTTPLRFIALVASTDHTDTERFRTAVRRGVDYLLAAQYANGGFPQFYPLRQGYYSCITYNDGAMINALDTLRDVASGRPPFSFLDKERRAKSAAAVSRGIDCILRTQLKQNGRLAVWCAQYDEKTLEPAWARKYEPPSLSGSESSGTVRFLMAVENPTPEIVAAIEAAVTWFESAAIRGQRVETFTDAAGRRDRRVVLDPSAPTIWARFYDLGTNRPLFLGRDSVFHYTFAEIEQERRAGYAYHGDWPATLLARQYPAWRAKWAAKTK